MKKEKRVQKETELRRELGTRKSPRKHDVKRFYKESSSEEDKSKKKKVGVSVIPFQQRGRADAMSLADGVPGVLFRKRGPLCLSFQLPVVYFCNAFCHLYRLEIANVISSVVRFPPFSFIMSLGRWLLGLLVLFLNHFA